MNPIVIAPYDPEWANEFARIKNYLWPQVSDLAVDILHIGSTSVPGLAAKPIIDLNIVIESYDSFPLLAERLKTLGYEHTGDGGLLMRERFAGGKRDGFMEYNLYVAPMESRILLAQVLFCDYLRRHGDARMEYAGLKQSLAEKYPNNLAAYVDGKHAFIMSTVNSAIRERQAGSPKNAGESDAVCTAEKIICCHSAILAEYDAG